MEEKYYMVRYDNCTESIEIDEVDMLYIDENGGAFDTVYEDCEYEYFFTTNKTLEHIKSVLKEYWTNLISNLEFAEIVNY